MFQERIEAWKREQKKEMPTADQIEFDDPATVADCSQQIYLNMKKQEVSCMVDPDYLKKVQTEIKDTSRAFLIEWIIDVHRKFRLSPETLYVT